MLAALPLVQRPGPSSKMSRDLLTVQTKTQAVLVPLAYWFPLVCRICSFH
jgi:hypothetical protein